jgi:dolichol-phosphate mannosyltransferase
MATQIILDAPLVARSMIEPPNAARRRVEVSIVVPTFNELGNVTVLVERLSASLAGVGWEVIFVDDDSPDGTAAAIKDIAERDPRVRCLRRIARRGLAGACIDGLLFSAAPYVAVMDADLQHDQSLLPRMLAMLKANEADLVVASRYVVAHDVGAFGKTRAAISTFATQAARCVGRARLADPLSGFFMMRRECFDAVADGLSTQGFKILLDIVLTAGGRLRIAELPYVFAQRLHGESKLDARVVMDFAGLLLAKATGGAVTSRFLSFALVGVTGLGVHLLALRTAMLFLGIGFGPAQATATLFAMTSNFFLNNALTYRDRQLRGFRVLRGLFGFYALCSVGAIANVGVAAWLYASQPGVVGGRRDGRIDELGVELFHVQSPSVARERVSCAQPFAPRPDARS